MPASPTACSVSSPDPTAPGNSPSMAGPSTGTPATPSPVTPTARGWATSGSPSAPTARVSWARPVAPASPRVESFVEGGPMSNVATMATTNQDGVGLGGAPTTVDGPDDDLDEELRAADGRVPG